MCAVDRDLLVFAADRDLLVCATEGTYLCVLLTGTYTHQVPLLLLAAPIEAPCRF